ncbi:proline-rich protein 36-like [Anabrus simplex]|uniref:proline-rich protein 36-like n=1 Tax=Anabrus simplex TaxID=316456 RepID=UPI0034DD0097
MRSLVLVAAFVQVVLGGGSQVAVQLPYLNPAGVTYLSGPTAPGLAAGPAYAAPAHVGLAHGLAQAPAYGYAAPAAYATHAVGYATAQVPGVAAVPTVHHVPGVADVPVTSVQATPGVVQKLVDVARPAVSTRKFEVRRPAIQKQFYDIEERVVVRPAGSALVELDQPLSKTQRGPAVINPVAAPVGYAAAPAAHLAYAAPAVHAVHAAPAYADHVAVTPASFAISSTPAPTFVSSTPAPPPQSFGPQGPIGGPSQFQGDGDSVVVENSDFAARSAAAARNEAEARGYAQGPAPGYGPTPSPSPLPGPAPSPAVQVRANGAPGPVPGPHDGPSVVPSLRSLDPHENQANQQRLIQLLTEQGGVAEVGFGRAGPSPGPVGDAGAVRARVLSATAAPAYAEPAGERVSTRRVVVSRPIETLQEIDVVEPVTKLERVAVNHPTVFKTLRQDIARVPTSIPVHGKALVPTVHHATVPVAHAAPLQYGYLH